MSMDDRDMPGDAPRQDQLLEEGSAWFARMRGPNSDQYQAEFDAWLARGAAHRGAYNRAGEIFALGKFLSESPHAAAGEGRASHSPPSRFRGLAFLALAFITIVTASWINRDTILRMFGHAPEITAALAPTLQPGMELATRSGERRSFTLADGSKVTLDPDSQLSTVFGTERRELRLKRGRARFDVAHEARPFVVFAGGGSVTARGTIFDVIIGGDEGVTVRLLRGAVDVIRPGGPAGAPQAIARLAPGEELSFGDSALPDLAVSSRASAAFEPAPMPGSGAAREFDMVPLSEVIAQANHGSSIPIRVSEPSVGYLKVSGRFRTDDPERVAEHLATLFDLEIDRSHSNELVLRPQ